MNSSPCGFQEIVETITFHCHAPHARRVSLVGDFNNWSATTHPMRKEQDGSWFVTVPLNRGRHYYQFLVDGQPVLDPAAMCTFGKEDQSKVSLIALS